MQHGCYAPRGSLPGLGLLTSAAAPAHGDYPMAEHVSTQKMRLPCAALLVAAWPGRERDRGRGGRGEREGERWLSERSAEKWDGQWERC